MRETLRETRGGLAEATLHAVITMLHRLLVHPFSQSFLLNTIHQDLVPRTDPCEGSRTVSLRIGLSLSLTQANEEKALVIY